MIINILIFVYAITYFWLAWRRLEWAVLLMITALPVYLIRFNVGVPMTLLELMILISFFIWLITRTNFKLFLMGKYGWKDFKENRLKREKYPWRWEIMALLIISWIAIAVGGFTNEALGIWKAYFFEPILVFILILNLFRDKKGIEKIILALAVSAFAVSILAIYQKLTGNLIDNALWAAPTTRRVVSFFGYPNAVGLYLGPIVMILVGYIFQLFAGQEKSPRDNNQDTNKSQETITNNQTGLKIKKLKIDWKLRIENWKLKELFIAFTIFISLLSIAFAKSEGAMLGLAVAFFVFGILAGRKIRWATLIVAIVIGGGVLAYTPARVHVLDLIQLHNFSGQVRSQQWKETRQMLNDGHFIFGAGLANYQKVIKPYHQEGIFVYDFHDPNFHAKLVASDELKKKVWQPLEIYLYPHNILLNFWSELGLLGMLLFIWIFIKFFWVSILNFQPCLPAGRFSIFNKFSIFNSKLNNSEFIGNSKLKINNYFISLGLMSAMIVIVIHGLVDVPYFKNDLSVLFWVIVAMLSIINLQNKKNV